MKIRPPQRRRRWHPSVDPWRRVRIGVGLLTGITVVGVVGYWLLGLPLGWYFGIRIGWLEGLWWALVLGLAVVACSLVMWIRFRGPDTVAVGERVTA